MQYYVENCNDNNSVIIGKDPIKGKISLLNKLEPTCTRNNDNNNIKEELVVILNTCDISQLKLKLNSLEMSYWSDETQVSEGNVKLVRPAHDNWGIKKIAFTFCDDVIIYLYKKIKI